jgi:hypothetical protein
MPFPRMRDLVAPLATSQEWNCVHDVRIDSPWRPTDTRFTFSSLGRSNGKASLLCVLYVLRQSLSLLSANFSPVLYLLLGVIRLAIFPQRP